MRNSVTSLHLGSQLLIVAGSWSHGVHVAHKVVYSVEQVT